MAINKENTYKNKKRDWEIEKGSCTTDQCPKGNRGTELRLRQNKVGNYMN